jgi:hypothetical protein
MDKMKNNAPNFEHSNSENPDNSPIGYPDMSGRDPKSYGKIEPAKRHYVYHEGPVSHSVNPERPTKYKGASESELKSMKLAK